MIGAALALFLLQTPAAPAAPGRTAVEPAAPTRATLITAAVLQLVAIQEGGEWPYEGVYRVGGEIPIGYRIGGTSIVATTLLHAAAENAAAKAAIARGLESVLGLLDHPLMKPSTEDTYDVRVWGHSYALAFLCELRAAKQLGTHEADALRWIQKLVETLVTEEIPGGGWNYANHKQPATFVTGPVIQSLLLARGQTNFSSARATYFCVRGTATARSSIPADPRNLEAWACRASRRLRSPAHRAVRRPARARSGCSARRPSITCANRP